MKDLMKSKNFKLIVVIIALLIMIIYMFISLSNKYYIEVLDTDYFSSMYSISERLDEYEVISSNEQETLYYRAKVVDSEILSMNLITGNEESEQIVEQVSTYFTLNKQQLPTRRIDITALENQYIIEFSYFEYNEQNQVIKQSYSWTSLLKTGYCFNVSHDTTNYYYLSDKIIAVGKVNTYSEPGYFVYDTDLISNWNIAVNNTTNK